MHIFEKSKKNPSAVPKDKLDNEKKTVIKKRKRIGFKPTNKTNNMTSISQKKKPPENIEKTETDNTIYEDTSDALLDENLISDLTNEEKTNSKEIIKEKTTDKPVKKKKTIIKKDMKGKPVYLEDTGEKLGVVFDSIYDGSSNLVGFKIKDKKSDAVLSFPLDQFDLNKDGLIFLPGWYTNAMKIIEKLEFKDNISPELTALLSDDSVSNKELYDIFVKHDDDMAEYIDDAVALKGVLSNRLKILEKQRLSMKEGLLDLTEKRLIKDIDRREFSQDVLEHRRKANILDVNIKKSKDLMKRLDITSFGALGDSKTRVKDDIVADRTLFENKEASQFIAKSEKQLQYKEKYYALKDQFDQLEEEYLELRTSIEKLFGKNDL